MYLLILLQVMPRPGSSQVSSAAASDVEMEGGIEQRHMLDKAGERGLLKTMLTVNGNDRKTLTLQVSTQVLLMMKLAEK